MKDKKEIARGWLTSLVYNKVIPLNDAQRDIIKSIQNEYDNTTSDFRVKLTVNGVEKVDNELNPANYDEVVIEKWHDGIQAMRLEKVYAPRIHKLNEIIKRNEDTSNNVEEPERDEYNA